jgi:RNA polymerase sigma-70 factor (ECF subfamily)
MSDGFADSDATLHETIARYSPSLRAAARRFARDGDDLEDLVQETWIRAYRKRDSYAGGSLLSWLLAICRNICLARQRTAHSRARHDVIAHDDEFETHGPDLDVQLDLRHALEALTSLPDRQRDAITMRLIEGYSTRETAARMKCAEGTVKALLHQAIQNLRENHAERNNALS